MARLFVFCVLILAASLTVVLSQASIFGQLNELAQATLDNFAQNAAELIDVAKDAALKLSKTVGLDLVPSRTDEFVEFFRTYFKSVKMEKFVNDEELLSLASMSAFMWEHLDPITAVPPVTFTMSLAAYLCLQYEVPPPLLASCSVSPTELETLHHYSRYASAAYAGLVKTEGEAKQRQLVSRYVGVSEADVLHAHLTHEMYLPGHVLVRNPKTKELVLALRGTVSVQNILAGLAGDSVAYTVGSVTGQVHSGVLRCAQAISRHTLARVQTELKAHPDYSLAIVGHSLGGAVCAVLANEWREKLGRDRVPCYAFGPPGLVDNKLANEMSRYVTTVINNMDFVPRLSVGSLKDLQQTAITVSQQEGLAEEIVLDFLDFESRPEADSAKRMKSLREAMQHPKLYPPGKLVWLEHLKGKQSGPESCEPRQSPPEQFSEIVFSRTMVSDHAASAYESHLATCIGKEP